MRQGESSVRDRLGSPEFPGSTAGLPERLPDSVLSPRKLAARRWLVRTGLTVFVWLVTSALIVHGEQAPSYALVLEDNAHSVYLSPSCALGRGTLPIATIKAAKHAGLRPDPGCEQSGGFLGTSHSALEQELAFFHLYPKRGTRWRTDGTWKW